MLRCGNKRRQTDYTKAVSQSKQGQWTSWENLELTWKNLWKMEGSQVSFIIRATYDVPPTPKNLNQWFGEDPNPCNTEAHPHWLQNQFVPRPLYLETQPGPTTAGDTLPPPMPRHSKHHPFCKSRTTPSKAICKSGSNPPRHCRDRRMQVDLDQRLIFPPEINLKSDLVLWSTTQKLLFIVELIVL